ncbi:MAG: hypothetical protein AAGA96_07150 [Verrucomicrobiota bacterium]
MKTTTLAAFALALLPLQASAQTRVFTSSDGRQIEAEVVSVSDTETVIKRGTKRFTVPLTSLSDADQKFLADWRTEQMSKFIPKLEVFINSGKSDRSDRDDTFDDRVGSFKFSIKIENDERDYTLAKGKAELAVLGESCENDEVFCIMQRTSFDVMLEDGGVFEWEGEERRYTFDNRTPTLWGFEYLGYVLQIKNDSGNVIFTKVTPSKMEEGIEEILKMASDTAFDEKFKSKGRASIRD